MRHINNAGTLIKCGEASRSSLLLHMLYEYHGFHYPRRLACSGVSHIRYLTYIVFWGILECWRGTQKPVTSCSFKTTGFTILVLTRHSRPLPALVRSAFSLEHRHDYPGDAATRHHSPNPHYYRWGYCGASPHRPGGTPHRGIHRRPPRTTAAYPRRTRCPHHPGGHHHWCQPNLATHVPRLPRAGCHHAGH